MTPATQYVRPSWYVAFSRLDFLRVVARLGWDPSHGRWRSLKLRTRLPARLGERVRIQGWRWNLDQVLHPQVSPSRPWRQTIRCGLLAEKRQNSTRLAGATSSVIPLDPVQ